MNFQLQHYKGVPIRQINRQYRNMKARRFLLNDTSQNVWIPNCYLTLDGTLKPNINIDFVFRKSKRKFELAGIIELYQPFKQPNYTYRERG